MPRLRRRPSRLAGALGALILLVSALGARWAGAELAVGRRAPELHVLDAWGGPKPSLAGSLGRLVLLEFFRVDCPHCRASVEHVNALRAAGQERGLEVVALGFEDAERLQAFRRDLRAAYAVARVPAEVFRDYDVKGLPRAFLVSPEGLVLWSGRPADLPVAELTRRLEQAQPWPMLPPEVEPAAGLLRAGRLAEGRAALLRLTAQAGCPPPRERAARALLAWSERYVRALTAAADVALARGDPFEAWRAQDTLARGLGDLPEGEVAQRARAALESDAARKREIDAGRALESARAAWREQGDAAGKAALTAVAQAHAGTAAGAAAAAIAARL